MCSFARRLNAKKGNYVLTFHLVIPQVFDNLLPWQLVLYVLIHDPFLLRALCGVQQPILKFHYLTVILVYFKEKMCDTQSY